MPESKEVGKFSTNLRANGLVHMAEDWGCTMSLIAIGGAVDLETTNWVIGRISKELVDQIVAALKLRSYEFTPDVS